MTIKWKLEEIPIQELNPYYKNPRYLSDHDYDHLKDSLEKFGLIDKPIINLDKTIIGGHQRISILKNNSSIQCWIPDRLLNDKEVEELNIRLNRNNGSWDWDLLANEFNLLDICNWGFKHDEILGKPLLEDKNEEEDQKKEKHSKKKKECPNCGHQF